MFYNNLKASKLFLGELFY